MYHDVLYHIVLTKAAHQVFFFVKGESICFIPVADISLNFVDTEVTCIDISPLVSPLQKHLEYWN